MVSILISLYLGGVIILSALCFMVAKLMRSKGEKMDLFRPMVSLVLLWPASLPYAGLAYLKDLK